MKKLMIFAAAIFITVSSFANEGKVSEKAVKAFEATFSDAQNVVWTDSDGYYSVQFIQQGIATYVNYDKQGNFLTSRRYYQSAKLPVDIQCQLQKKFAGKTVFGVTEFTVANEVYYFVNLEDASSWTKVRIDNARNIEVIEKFKK